MRVWRMSLRRTKSAIISWDGSYYDSLSEACSCLEYCEQCMVLASFELLIQQMSRDMTKPTKWVCTQRRLRSAWASAQSDQSSLCTQWVAKDPQLSSCRQLRLWPDWADAQADLRLRWAHTHFVGFVMSLLKLCVLNLPLYPSNTKSTIGLAVSLYMSTCLESGA